MKPLNKLSLRAAVDKCCKEDGYKVLVAARSSQEAALWFDIASSYIIANQNKKDLALRMRRCSYGDNDIQFKNGSYIRFISASRNARGYAVHLVLFSRGINEEVVDYVLKYTEKLWR